MDAISLHDAARAGDTAKVLSLLAGGQKVDARDKHSRTALHMAAWAGQAAVVEALLASKANRGATAMDDMNALHFAAQKGHTSTSEVLLEHDGSIDKTPPRLISKHCLLQETQSFLHAGLSVKTQNRKGQTALHIAAAKGYSELVKLLLEHKADPKALNRKQQTSIDVASSDEIRSMLEAEVTKAQERLDRIRASVKASENPDARQNVRKRQQDRETDIQEDQKSEQEKPLKKRTAVSLSHLGEEDE